MSHRLGFEFEFDIEKWLGGKLAKNRKAAYLFAKGLPSLHRHWTLVFADNRFTVHWTDETKQEGHPDRNVNLFGVSLPSFETRANSMEFQQAFFQLVASARVRTPRDLKRRGVAFLVRPPRISPQTKKLRLFDVLRELRFEPLWIAWRKPARWGHKSRTSIWLAADEGGKSVGGLQRLTDERGRPVVLFYDHDLILGFVELLFSKVEGSDRLLAGFRDALEDA